MSLATTLEWEREDLRLWRRRPESAGLPTCDRLCA